MKFSFILLALLAGRVTLAQVKTGDNPAAINVNSLLELESTNKGLLLPRLALASTTAFAPMTAHVAGMTVYNTATTGDVTPGYYYNDGTKWLRLLDAAALDLRRVNGTSHITQDAGVGSTGTNAGADEVIAIGAGAGNANTGQYNVFIGTHVGITNTSGHDNTATGMYALIKNTSGYQNTATGTNALSQNSTGNFNTANGSVTLYDNTAGSNNTANGYHALIATTGSNNTAVGSQAGTGVSSGNNNTVLGYSTQVPVGSADNQVRVGDANVTYAGVQVAWTVTSDKRWKSDVQNIPMGLNLIQRLRPVDYMRSNTDKNSFMANTREAGFIAQEVEETLAKLGYGNRGIVSTDDKGFYGLRYNDFIPVLVKGMQEQQSQIQEQQAQIEDLKKAVKKLIEALQK